MRAFAAEVRVMLGQVAVDVKSNEIAVMPVHLEMLELKGRIVPPMPCTGNGRRRERSVTGVATTCLF